MGMKFSCSSKTSQASQREAFNQQFQRDAPFMTQITLLMKRSWQFAARNRRSQFGILVVAICNAGLYSIIFHNVGKERMIFNPLDPYNKDDLAKNQRNQQNFVGLVFFAGMDNFMSPALAQVLQLPILKPVFFREQSSKMYSSSAYFLSGWFTSTFNLLMYPIVSSLISFWSLGLNDSSFSNYLNWLGMLILLTIQGSTLAFMFGSVCHDMQEASDYLATIIMFQVYGSGVYTSLKDANWFVKFLGYTSPFRYANERLMRLALKDLSFQDQICDFYDYTYKDEVIPISILFIVIFFFFGWFGIWYQAK